MVQPGNSYSDDLGYEFILICFYLQKKGYYIEQFPKQLSNPDTLSIFAENKIREYLIAKKVDDGGTVRWATRRNLIMEFSFVKSSLIHYELTEEMEASFKEISTRGASFDQMSNEEKIKEISNLIENKLLKGKKFIEFDESHTVNLLTNKDLIKYRKVTHCYRHGKDECLKERKSYKNNELFLIQLGLIYLQVIFESDDRQDTGLS